MRDSSTWPMAIRWRFTRSRSVDAEQSNRKLFARQTRNHGYDIELEYLRREWAWAGKDVKHQLRPYTTAVSVAQAGSGGFLQGALAFTGRHTEHHGDIGRSSKLEKRLRFGCLQMVSHQARLRQKWKSTCCYDRISDR